MCFELRREVKYVEEPEHVEKFTVFKTIEPLNVKDACSSICMAARIYLHNKIIEAALSEAEKYQVKELSADGQIDPIPDRSVVICSMVESRHLMVGEVVHPDQVLASPHVRMDNTTIVLQLKDFSYVVEFSLQFIDDALLPENVFQQAELRIKFGLASETGVVYHRINGESNV